MQFDLGPHCLHRLVIQNIRGKYCSFLELTLVTLLQLVLVFGLTILIASTYTTLSSQEKKLEVVKAEDLQMPENPVDGQKPVLDTMEKIIEDVKPPEENKNEGIFEHVREY